ncbi:hypothetical protein FA10DRAFT_128144 [Acaromyces ingoldii]|uniref:C2H2-type domain-containing protein n=1 Tax=Acaromyces ingoldii TaxID=215250 RepID=A0A316YQ62_9BASI|nr:hypothetical protein FA10DRAFT_128144 [Acaromyces ingoldii]PWN90954.1 hypothetical protein FA10DRAFT_128144 [Acaromyces ingoldii]
MSATDGNFFGLYASLASRLDLDLVKKELASAPSAMFSTHPYAASDEAFDQMKASSSNNNYGVADKASAIPFDSPLDQSMGSPASSRDFGSPTFQDLDFDFSGVADAPLFPCNGTQEESHNNGWLSGIPLFGDELVAQPRLSQSQSQQAQTSFPTASQQQRELAKYDFSFDSALRQEQQHQAKVDDTFATLNARAPSEPRSDMRSASPDTQPAFDQSYTVEANKLVREFARSKNISELDMLIRALKVAGINVSDDAVLEAMASASVSTSPVSSPSASQASSQSSTSSPPVSPVVLPTAVAAVRRAESTSLFTDSKTRSSIQASAKRQTVGESGLQGKRFVCDSCGKTFDRHFNLRTHAMTHIKPEDRERPFVCPWGSCAKPFSRKYDAERHYRSIHVKKGELATRAEIEEALSGRHDHQHDSVNVTVEKANG